MTRETLACEFDGHFWSREATRGRKPKRCPKHPKLTQADAALVAMGMLPEPEVDEPDFEIVGYVDVPVTLRSTKTSKEAPQSPQEPFTPRLVTRGKGQGGKAASEPLDGQNGQNELTPSPELSEEPDLEVQVLYCANGDHEWTRPAGMRGRKPANCKQHPNVVDLDANAEERRRKAEARIDNLEMLLMSRGTHIKQQKEREFPMPNRPEWKDKAKGTAGSLKGSRRTVKATKRDEAEIRNANTLPGRRSRKKVA